MNPCIFSGRFMALLALSSAFLSAQAPTPAKRGMVPDDLDKLLTVANPQVSPEGDWVAYTVTSVDTADDKHVTQLWMVSWDGKQNIQLTYGKESAEDPQWSPDGRWLAFLASRDDGDDSADKGDQVWVLDRRGGEAHPLTDVKGDLQEYRWSPDSKTLLLSITPKDEPEGDKDAKPHHPRPIVLDRFHFKNDEEGYLTDKHPHLFLFDVATRKMDKLTNGTVEGRAAYAEEDGTWSPDGAMIAFVSNQALPDPDRVENPDVWVVSAKPGSVPKKLTTFAGGDVGPLVWTPDSRAIVYRQSTQPVYSMYDQQQLALISVTGGKPTMLAPGLDAWVEKPVLAPGGKSVLTEVPADRVVYVAEVPLDGSGKVTRLVTSAGSAGPLHQAHGHVAVEWSNDTSPVEIYALENNKLRKLTAQNDSLLAQLDLVPAIDLSAKAKDGSEVHSVLTLPVGYVPGSKVPMLLRIHGGPVEQEQHEFDEQRQLFAAHGYAVLNVNYRGSSGRGALYSSTISGDWGNKEVLDLLAAVDGAIATGDIDPGKMGIGGWSYGGILTDYMIATTNEFKAASSGAGMGNVLGFYGIDEYILQYENELGPPWKNLDRYVKLSYPFLHADRIKTPTLFMGGDKDFNVPLAGGEQMYQALKSVGTPAELIVYPGQFHGFTRPSFIKDRYVRWFAWYDTYVKGVEAPKTKAVPAE